MQGFFCMVFQKCHYRCYFFLVLSTKLQVQKIFVEKKLLSVVAFIVNGVFSFEVTLGSSDVLRLSKCCSKRPGQQQCENLRQQQYCSIRNIHPCLNLCISPGLVLLCWGSSCSLGQNSFPCGLNRESKGDSSEWGRGDPNWEAREREKSWVSCSQPCYKPLPAASPRPPAGSYWLEVKERIASSWAPPKLMS